MFGSDYDKKNSNYNQTIPPYLTEPNRSMEQKVAPLQVIDSVKLSASFVRDSLR